MIQGTSSDAGKSFLVTGLCRIFSDKGYRVCPFKSQNMSNNSCVTKDGLEMGRAQAVQAEAAHLDPSVFMNPILLKPRKDTVSEIVLMGRVFDAPADREYYRTFTMGPGLSAVREALKHIERNFEAVLIEGAGSPAEINLNETEIVNMRVAREADVPVVLVTDVDRGGALASVVGTLDLLGADRGRVKGIVFNKFRGDISLFEPAVDWIEKRTGIKVVGVMPWVPDIRIASEDSLSIRWNSRRDGSKSGAEKPALAVGVVRFPYISNHTDLEAFDLEPDVELVEVSGHTSLQGLDAVILPGTKSTVRDMKAMRDSGLAGQLVEFHEKGGFLFGLCGGYQMLGRHIDDRHLRDNDAILEIEGLGLLPVVTGFEAEKTTIRSNGWMVHPLLRSSDELKIQGYEIHFGETRREAKKEETGFHSLFLLNGHEEGMADLEFRVGGTYLHNAFHNDAFRSFWLNALRRNKGLPQRPAAKREQRTHDVLAAQIRQHLDVDYIMKLAGVR
ncbi:MAG: cobyric acid synthase [Synergistaceae bacterium]|jgi:adenosylcobyric acid synthase|nr:cobyric acid synthase [Synergistaceae bacterium]